MEKVIPKILIVTPARNEASNLENLSDSLVGQLGELEFRWVIVDDNSTDNTQEVLELIQKKIDFRVINFQSSGRLISGGAFQTWKYGIDYGIMNFPDYSHVMKLDADVILSESYFQKLFNNADADAAILGGIIDSSAREQAEYVPGPVKLYSRTALRHILDLPLSAGLDVMDEVLCHSLGLKVCVVKEAKFKLNRPIGHSQGKLHGRYRNGTVCKWVGYSRIYFTFHVLRYLFRSPYLIGAVCMVAGFFLASEGPFPPHLKNFHREMQVSRLKRIIVNPIRVIRILYGKE